MSLDIKKARRRSFDVRHVMVTEENLDAVASWCNGAVGTDEGENGKPGARFIRVEDRNAVSTRQRTAYVGDRVVEMTSTSGTFTYKAYSEKNFQKSFEEVETVEVARSAVDGKFVSHEEAAAHPDTTVVETVDVVTDGVDPKTLGAEKVDE